MLLALSHVHTRTQAHTQTHTQTHTCNDAIRHKTSHRGPCCACLSFRCEHLGNVTGLCRHHLLHRLYCRGKSCCHDNRATPWFLKPFFSQLSVQRKEAKKHYLMGRMVRIKLANSAHWHQHQRHRCSVRESFVLCRLRLLSLVFAPRILLISVVLLTISTKISSRESGSEERRLKNERTKERRGLS